MAPLHSKTSAARPASSFFVARPKRNVPAQDYANIERPQFNPTNTPTTQATASSSSSTNDRRAESPEGESITVDIPVGHDNYPSDDEMPDVEADVPPLTDTPTPLTDIEKAIAIQKWRKDKKAHTRKKRSKNSHVYWYMDRETIPSVFYAETEGGPKIFQQFRWSCMECIRNPYKLSQKYTVLESNRRGVTSGMGDHLKKHGITKETHFARINGYGKGSDGGEYTEGDAWSGASKQRARLTARQATRRWFVKSRQPFTVVEEKSFQEMFLAHNTACSYKSRYTLRNHIYDDFWGRREKLKLEFKHDCISISFTLDMWTAPNRVPIFAIIGRWWTKDFEEREEVLEFLEVKGSHTGEALAVLVEKTLEDFELKPKLFAITGDNAGNNGTLCEALYQVLKLKFDDKVSLIGKPIMRFHGRPSWVRCLAHVVALICDDVLKDLNAGTAREAKKLLEQWEVDAKGKSYEIPFDATRSAPAKVRLLNLWILRSSPREQEWKELPKTSNRKPIYDVDTRWNSCKDMMEQFIELEPEYNHFIDNHPEIEALRLTGEEQVALHQLNYVLTPFKEHTLKVSKEMPSITESLEIYWDLDELLRQVVDGDGKFSELDTSVRDSFVKGRSKHLKYMKKLGDQAMIYSSHTLDPRHRMDLIKTMMPDKVDEVLTTIKSYLIREFPTLGVRPEAPTPSSYSIVQPDGMGIAQWKALQARRAREAEAGATTPSSELDRWLAAPPIYVDEDEFKSPDYVRRWWKAHATEWPLLAQAARVLIPTSASEVDVERLFSGCRDEFGIRRHSLKAETVRVLTLLRSAYTSEDEVDKELIKSAMELDILPFRNCILWRPDVYDRHINEPSKCTDLTSFYTLG